MAVSSSPVSKEAASDSAARLETRNTIRRLRVAAAATLVFGSITVIGILDRSVRDDPFTADPGLLQWLTKPQPDPHLALMPVLPMGRAGVLSWRPRSTVWLTEQVQVSGAIPGRAAFEWLRVDRAYAEEPPRKVPPKLDGPASPEKAETSKSLGNAVQQLPSQQQVPREASPPLAKTASPRPTLDPSILVPEPEQDTRFSQLPSRSRLLSTAFWAGCDLNGMWCARLDGTSRMTSDDGGRSWQPDSDAASAPILLINSKPRQLISGTPAVWLESVKDASSQRLIDAQLPFAVAAYGVDNEIRGFRSSKLTETAEQTIDTYLRRTGLGDRLHFFGVVTPNEPDVVAKIFILFSKGKALTAVLRISEHERISQETKFIDLPTKANLRSLHFQPDQQIGWISSGWNDGNEEGERPAIFQTTDGGQTWERLSYRYQFAPWVLYFAIPGLIFGFFATGASWRDYQDRRVEEGIAGVGTSDAPIGWNDLDVLGLKPLALALSRFVRNTSTAPPLTISVVGPWGTGKSSLMNLVAEDLRARGANPVWFNAWHHQKEENILAALLENIRAQAIPSAWRLSGLWFRMRLVVARMGKDVVPLLLGIAVIATCAYAIKWSSDLLALSTWLKGHNVGEWRNEISQWLDHVAFVGAGALLLGVINFYGRLNLKPSELMATLRVNAKLADFSAQLGFRYKFAKEFSVAGQALRTSTNPGLVIFIDDLDRCAPENLTEVLESINFLTTAGPCFVFLGMDEPKVVEIIAKQFGDDAQRARQYLKKLINLTVPVPEVSEGNSISLSSGNRAPPSADSPWPPRIRAGLRYVPDAGIPALVLILGIWVLATVANNMSIASGPVPGVSAGGNTTADAGPTQTGPANPQPGSSNDGASPELRIPTVSAAQLMRHRQMQPYLGMALSALIILLWSVRRITIAQQDRVEDSRSFRDALTIWHPAVFAADPTPRGVKRHQNRLRLQAMRLRPSDDSHDLLDRWFGKRIKHHELGPEITEPTLVALAAIVALCGGVPNWAVSAPQPAPDSGPDSDQHAIIARCAGSFERRFPNDWPPSETAIDAFKTLRDSL
jgi:hypothetical protein